MASITRRGFIRRGLAGSTALGLLNRGKGAMLAALTPAAAVARSQPMRSGGQAKTSAEMVVTRKEIRQGFGGVGFHAQMFLETATQDFFDQVLAKRWHELNPRFARIFHSWAPGEPGKRDAKVLEAMARQMVFMKEASGTEIYLTTSELKDTVSPQELRSYAAAVVDDLEYLLNRGATNLKYYCCTNELSLVEWADMHDDLPRYRAYHAAIADEIKRRKLAVKLLATDASPTEYWGTIEWATKNMDDISGVYGGHHYINEQAPDNLEFYNWFLGRCRWAVGLAKAKGKDFILGEFGPAQYFDLRYGVRWDTCKYYGTPLEGLAGLQLAEAALAALNAGVYAMGYWTFTDYPDRSADNSINHWGVFKWLTNGAEVRAPYYSYGLLTKFFRGLATVFQVEGGDELLRVAALQHEAGKTWSLAALNRHPHATEVVVRFEGVKDPATFRKYVYDPRHVPVTEDGDLQEPEGKVRSAEGKLRDTVEAGTLAVYTTAYDETPPAPVKGLEVAQIRDTRLPGQTAEANRLTWTASTDADLCYYRIYHNGIRIGSTVTTEFLDTGPTRSLNGPYSVVAVDQSGNAGPP
jgi:hypothetical protein